MGIRRIETLAKRGAEVTMKFTWLNKQGVRSDAGFELQRIDRFTIEYREGPRTITIDIEDGMIDGTIPAVIMETDSIGRWDDGIPVLQDKQFMIIANIRAALVFQGVELRLE